MSLSIQCQFRISKIYHIRRKKGMVKIMKKQNMGLAMEILRDLKHREQFWRIAFLVTLAVAIVKSIAGKAGRHSDKK